MKFLACNKEKGMYSQHAGSWMVIVCALLRELRVVAAMKLILSVNQLAITQRTSYPALTLPVASW
jgi:hypothetical protein